MRTKLSIIMLCIIILFSGCAKPKMTKPTDMNEQTWNKVISYTDEVFAKIKTLKITANSKEISYNEDAFLTDEKNKEIMNFYSENYNRAKNDEEKELLDSLYNLVGNYMFVKVNATQYNQTPTPKTLDNLTYTLNECKTYSQKLSKATGLKYPVSIDDNLKSINTVVTK